MDGGDGVQICRCPIYLCTLIWARDNPDNVVNSHDRQPESHLHASLHEMYID